MSATVTFMHNQVPVFSCSIDQAPEPIPENEQKSVTYESFDDAVDAALEFVGQGCIDTTTPAGANFINEANGREVFVSKDQPQALRP